MLVALLLFIGFLLGRMVGYTAGWRDGIHIARLWEGVARDYKMIHGMEAAETEEEVRKAEEIRQIERMYDGY